MTDDELKGLFAALQRENAGMREENAAAHAATRRQVELAATDTRRQVELAATETRRQVELAATDTRRHFDVVTEGTRTEIQLVAQSVLHLNGRLARTDEKIELSAAETQAMIKFSHVEIDRRVRSLEEAVADLQTRVERLEGSTH